MGRRYFIRFGLPPDSGQSRNYRTGEFEVGISAYNAAVDPVSGVWSCVGEPQPSDPHPLLKTVQGYTVVLVTGTILNSPGSDGEPLLSAVRIVADLEHVDGVRDAFRVSKVRAPELMAI